eukprot:TRINITY_DN4935_c0_g1_i1.p1 TRINITY_DN4935_c0_g1~~TRINITY_DN4935_c0_g1_i1.p1  ORF type:complete len:467 (-),score=70.11 TRINITY_DN4935_c0_g1_i1:17-1417(-)
MYPWVDLQQQFEKYLLSFQPLRIKADFRLLKSIHFRHFEGGRRILSHFRNPKSFIETLYPFHLTPDDTDQAPKNYWHSGTNRKKFLEFLSRKIRFIERYPDWKKVDSEMIVEYNGSTLLQRNLSVMEIWEENFPEYDWEKGVGREKERRLWVDGFVVEGLGDVQTKKDVESVTSKGMTQACGGWNVLHAYGDSPETVFMENYPELCIRRGWNGGDSGWTKRNNMDMFILKYVYFVSTKEDFKELTVVRILQFPGGWSILKHYNNSPQLMLQETYPELIGHYPKKAIQGYWKNLKTNFILPKLMNFYDLKQQEDWYKLSVEQFAEIYGKGVSKRNLINLLEHWHPELKWDKHKFSIRRNKRSAQRFLGLKLLQLFPNQQIHEDYKFKANDKDYIFDFYLPSLGLVIEYQGEQHYYSVMRWLSFEQQQQKDEEKALVCLHNHLKVLHVPYWWDKSLASLQLILSPFCK